MWRKLERDWFKGGKWRVSSKGRGLEGEGRELERKHLELLRGGIKKNVVLWEWCKKEKNLEGRDLE